MNKPDILQQTELYVRNEMEGESSGHDWWHVYRVRNTALTIAREENADLFIVEMAALLHDIGDPKLYEGDTTVAPRLIGGKLDELNVGSSARESIMYITANMSYSKSLDGKEVEKSKEFMVVQDADRLDAMGAIGIGRAFAYGGHKGRIMYDPDIKPVTDLTTEQYRAAKSPTLTHFDEKLLFLKDSMNTETGKRLAQIRHEIMEDFLKQFHLEWNGRS